MEFKLEYPKPLDKKWLVIYVRPKWEKRVDQLLKEQGIESFCPTVSRLSQWADRKKMIATPLFSGYVFVNIDDRDLTKVRCTSGVLNYIYFMGRPAIIKNVEMEKLMYTVAHYNDLRTVSLNEFSPGDRVRIKSGLFHNLEGNVIKVQGANILMTFDHLDCILVTSISVNAVVKTTPLKTTLCVKN